MWLGCEQVKEQVVLPPVPAAGTVRACTSPAMGKDMWSLLAEQSWCPFWPPPPPHVTVICEGSRGCDWLTVLPRTSFLGPWGRPGVICLPSSTCLLFSQCPALCDPHGLPQIRLLCPPLSPGVCSDSCPLSWWYYPTISSSVVPFSSCLQSFPTPGFFFLMSWLITSGGQSVGASASASVLPMNIQDWFPLGLTGWISS